MCDERERLIGYVYDECSAGERQEIEAHLSMCHTCREEIGGLRSVREDLLAWEVPPHDPIWRPVRPAPAKFGWRDLPVWAATLAAGLLLLVGGAGGVLTHAVLASRQAPLRAAAPATGVGTPVALSQADADAIYRRVLAAVQSDMDRREQRVMAEVSARTQVSPRASVEELRQQVADDLRSDQVTFSRAITSEFDRMNTRQSKVERTVYQMSSMLQPGQ